MNPTEQRQHRKVTDAISEAVMELATASADRFVAIERMIAAGREEAQSALDAERNYRRTHEDALRSYVDRADKAIGATLSEFVGRGFWSRLKWAHIGPLTGCVRSAMGIAA